MDDSVTLLMTGRFIAASCVGTTNANFSFFLFTDHKEDHQCKDDHKDAQYNIIRKGHNLSFILAQNQRGNDGSEAGNGNTTADSTHGMQLTAKDQRADGVYQITNGEAHCQLQGDAAP